MYLVYDELQAPLTDFNLNISGRNPYNLRISGILRPIVIFRMVKDLLNHERKSYIANNVFIRKGGINSFELIINVKDFSRFIINRTIMPELLEFLDKDYKFDECPKYIRDNASVFNEVQVLNQFDEHLKVIDIYILFKGDMESCNNCKIFIKGRHQDALLIGLEKLKLKFYNSLDGYKVTGVLEMDAEYHNNYEGDYEYKLKKISNIEYF